MEYLNSPDLAADPRNHTVPLLDKILVPNREDVVWIVIPLLLHSQTPSHPFRYVSEVVELTDQFLEGLEFMHEHGIAHRDACTFNLMVDSTKLVPGGNFSFFRPFVKEDLKSRVDSVERRSVVPLKYYFIDFESSLHFAPDDTDPRCVGLVGQVRGIPEMSKTVPYNPFKTDIYQLGKAFQRLLDKHYGLEFLVPLCEAMTREVPDRRPSAAEAHQLLHTILSSFSEADMNRLVCSQYTSPKPQKFQQASSLSSRLLGFCRLRKSTIFEFKLIH